jgi:DNA-binding NtrC family response regulator
MRLLIIGNLNGQIGEATRIAHKRGANVVQYPNIEEALGGLREGNSADLIMIDVSENISYLVKALQNERIFIDVVACGVGVKSSAAVQAIQSGAKEYVPLPADEELIAAVLEAITEESKNLIYSSDVMAKTLKIADQVAPSDASVLITGESGTGKEVMARYLHEHSKRKNAKFIAVNCAAIPDNLLESELFGHEKGAFTGALARRVGKFEESSGGTLFLDEISEMDIRLQAKLLRALQEKEIDRVGGTSPVKVDLRIIASSNRNLTDYVKEGKFREDLYYRLNVINLKLPALRERKGDIRPLAEFFIEKYSKANGVSVKPLSTGALQLMDTYTWKGNVRELENTMHRAVLLATGKEIDEAAIMLESLDSIAINNTELKTEERTPDNDDEVMNRNFVGRSLDDVEKELIENTLQHCMGNRTNAANILGISIRTLRNKLQQYKLEHLDQAGNG